MIMGFMARHIIDTLLHYSKKLCLKDRFLRIRRRFGRRFYDVLLMVINALLSKSLRIKAGDLGDPILN